VGRRGVEVSIKRSDIENEKTAVGRALYGPKYWRAETQMSLASDVGALC
jgi:hypothetical protein